MEPGENVPRARRSPDVDIQRSAISLPNHPDARVGRNIVSRIAASNGNSCVIFLLTAREKTKPQLVGGSLAEWVML